MSRRWFFLAVAVLLLAGGIYGLHRYYYPYGARHCCNKGLLFLLLEYAGEHGGRFPDAGGSAASLALVAGAPGGWDLVVGKGGSAEAAESYYRAHGTLPDEFSTWHYVPGLGEDSNPGLALFWDKTGLSHNGMRQNPVRYEVSFVDGGNRLIDEADWPEFLETQRRLREEDGKGEPVGD